MDRFVAEGSKQRKKDGDEALMLLLVGCAIPPTVLNNRFFQNFVNTIQPKYTPASASTMRECLIPNEAASVQQQVISMLRDVRNLTISFDGGKIRRPQGVYTVTVTTPTDRKSYIVDLNDASRVSHTSRYIAKEVIKPVRKV